MELSDEIKKYIDERIEAKVKEALEEQEYWVEIPDSPTMYRNINRDVCYVKEHDTNKCYIGFTNNHSCFINLSAHDFITKVMKKKIKTLDFNLEKKK